jgi:threonine synthase
VEPWRGIIHRFAADLPAEAGRDPITLYEGNTPLLPAPRLVPGLDLWLKLEGMNPTGSFKDRGMTVAVTVARNQGARILICASTGNTSASAAAYGARGGLRVAVVVPAGHIAMGKLAQALTYGADVLTVPGSFDEALSLVRGVAARRRDVALVNSVNPYRLEGQKTAALEVVEQLGRMPDILALPVGNAGNITAYHMGFAAAAERLGTNRLPQLLGFQAAGAAPMVLGRPVDEPETVATAIRIGRPASADKARRAADATGGAFYAVTDDEILAAWRRVADTVGVMVEPASAAPIAGLLKLRGAGTLVDDATVVAVLTGHGLKDPDTALREAAQEPRAVQDADQLERFLDMGRLPS